MVKEKQQNSHDTGAQGLRTDMQAQAKQERKFFEDCIVKIAKDKDRQAFVSLFEHFAPRIKSFLIKGGLDAELADELAQETMLAVWNKAESYKPEFATASTWIFRIARNKKIDIFRKQNPWRILEN